MRKLLLIGAILFASWTGKSQFTQNDLVYYVGDGPDTAVIVIDFIDGSPDSTYAWGYLFDATASVTAEDALEAINADEQMIDIDMTGGFLMGIHYNSHIGVGGDPNFWGTWSRVADTEWESNMGLGELLANGDWFGCSYTDFDPAILPGNPIPAYESAKYNDSMVQFWIGEGNDSAVFVVDFVVSPDGQAVSYAWGYLFDGITDGGTMLAAIDEADINLEIDAGSFLNDILFNGLAGLFGDPNYWATWSGTNLTDWTMNAGLATEIENGDWFGASYDAWPPRRPFNPISALDSADVVLDDVEFLTGSGSNMVVLVIDFNEWLPGQSYTFGYMFDTETITAEEVMIGMEEALDFGLEFDLTGGFLNNILYGASGNEGIGGDPNFWSTWSATNVGGWEINTGIATEMVDGDWFACSYSTWGPATPPSLPEAGYQVWGIDEEEIGDLEIYPNPAQKAFTFKTSDRQNEDVLIFQIIDVQGRMVMDEQIINGEHTIDITHLEPGVYFVESLQGSKRARTRLIVQ